jgi:hypothetical protein
MDPLSNLKLKNWLSRLNPTCFSSAFCANRVSSDSAEEALFKCHDSTGRWSLIETVRAIAALVDHVSAH